MDRDKGARRITALPVRRRRSFSLRKLVSAGGCIVICFLLVIIALQGLQQHRLKVLLAEQLTLVEEAENRNQLVAEEINRLDEPSYIEMLARRYLGLVKPGETVYQIKD